MSFPANIINLVVEGEVHYIQLLFYGLFMRGIILFIFCMLGWGLQAQNNTQQIRQWETQLTQASSDTTKVNLYFKLAKAHTVGNSNKALTYAKAGQQLARSINFKKGQSQLANQIGIIFYYKGVYDEALLNYFDALEINEIQKNDVEVGKNLNNIALTYQKLKQFDQALHYYFLAVPKLQKGGNIKSLAMLNNNIGIVYRYKKQYPQALEFYFVSLKLNDSLNLQQSKALTLNNIGQIYYDQGKYAENEEYTLRALLINRKLGNQYQITINLNNLGKAYTAQQKYGLATRSLAEARQLLPKLKSIDLWKDYYENMTMLLEQQGQYQEALKYFHQFNEVKDSIFNLDNSKRVAELQIRYGFEKKDKENRKLKKQKAESQLTIQTQRKRNSALAATTILGISLTLITLLAAYMLFRAKENQRQANKILAEKNEEIKSQADILQRQKEAIGQQKEELLSQTETLKLVNQRLKDLDNFKQAMTHMIVHDLKTPLNYLIALSDKIAIKQTGQQMLNMVLNILDVQKFEEAKMKLQKSEWNLSQIIEEAIKQVAFLANQKSVQIRTNTLPNTYVAVDYQLMVRVFANLLTNAIKYSPSSSVISIGQEDYKAQEEKPMVKLQVIDQGEGIPADKIAQVFDKFAQINARDLGNFRSTGLGLTFCKMVIEAHQGHIAITSPKQKGTIVTFSLPLVHSVTVVNNQLEDSQEWVDSFQQQTQELTELLTKTDKELITPLLDALQKMDVYDYSEVKKVLQYLDSADSRAIQRWKNAVHQTLLTCDEDRYHILLEMIK
ncbi:hypothetical protein BKI52_26180 [marine bacterium AO1-C]|nr:hypothetical protein BKI52_26180 [marine bacterium AO1-C]